MTETNTERLERIEDEKELIIDGITDKVVGVELTLSDYAYLQGQATRTDNAEALIRRLHNYLGTSVEMDFKLWKETEAYVKAISGETNGQRKA